MAIIAERIGVTDGQGRFILRDIDLHIPDGSISLIIGRNGAGKSTLLDALTGLVPLHTGTVMYEHESLWESDRRLNGSVLRQFGQVFQYPEQQLFASTIRKEFAYSLKYLKLDKKEVARRMEETMAQMNLDSAWSEESPHLLSGGQKRRLALATTLAARPKWLFLDEPTAGLDAKGVRSLVDFLTNQREQGVGLVIATHDLEALLPCADRIIVLAGGTVAAVLTRHELLHSQSSVVLREAGLEVPPALLLMEQLQAAGSNVVDHWLSPEEAVEEILHIHERKERVPGIPRSWARESKGASTETAQDTLLIPSHADPPQTGASRIPLAAAHDLMTFDPRGKWLLYMLLSMGIFLQSSWPGFFVGSIVALSIVIYVRVPWRPLLTVALPLIVLIIVSTLISSFSFEGDGQDRLQSSLRTVFELSKIFVVSMAGMALARVTTQLMIKSAIEYALRGLRHIRFPVEAIALGGSLMLRFITLFMQEYRRFGKIAKARAKDRMRHTGVRIRHLPVLLTPLIISLLQIASDLTTAMQARGLRNFGMKRTSRIRLRMERKDWVTVILGVILFGILVVIEMLA